LNNKFTILEILFSHAWGGLEILCAKFCEEFKKRGHDVYAVLSSNPPLEIRLHESTIPFTIINPGLKYLDFITSFKLSGIIREKKSQIIHAHISRNLSTIILGKKIAGQGKLIFTNHVDTRLRKKDIFHRWVYGNTSRIITVSEDMKKHMLDYSPVVEEKIETIYNGITVDEFQNGYFDREKIRKKYSLKDEQIVIGCVGRITSVKNQELLIRAAPQILRTFPDTLFLFAGSEDRDKYGKGYQQFLIDLSEKLGIENYVQFTGFVNDVAELIPLFDVLVLTTLKESFGLVLIEAMAGGIPVVASRAGGVPEIIEENINGKMYEPGNKDDLVRCVTEILRDEEKRKKMGRCARETVRDKFDFQKTISSYEEVFNMLA